MSRKKPAQLAVIAILIALISIFRSLDHISASRNIDVLTLFVGGVAFGVFLCQLALALKGKA